jgi:CheY-like chemotaxis protein
MNKMKVQFFTNVSHELRTPLTLILSPLEQIMSHNLVKGELKNKLSLVYNNAERLFGLVNELMDFSKSEESKLKMKVQKGDIIKYTHDLYSLFVDEARRRQIDYQFICLSDKIEAWFDRGKMEKILLNLISNAFKYTPDRGMIIVGIEKPAQEYKIDRNNPITNPEYVKISITDNGSGISQEYIDKVFDRFFQSPEDETRYNAGTGIGLALVKNLVELHHGSISLKSEKWVKTCFEVMLPLGNDHFNSFEINDEPMDISSPRINLVNTAVKKEADPQAPVLLIIEDNFALRTYLSSVFSSDYKVFEASDGEIGFRMATEEIPDLIISDILMPYCSGIELCKRVKGDLRTSHIPVILLTAKTTVDEQIEGIETGADAYVTKPFNIQLLGVQINQLIHSRRELYAHYSQDVYLRPNKLASNEVDQLFLQKVVDYILENITDSNLCVEGLSAAVNLSRSNMYRKIKALTGQSIIEFIRLIRLKQALKLMETKKHSLAEIAYLTGFTSPAYFTKSFKDQYGKPPSEYLKV